MSTKPIVIFASMLAMVATLTAAQATPTAPACRPAAASQGGSFPLALLILGPRHQAVG
jgi:hypothetical protein